MKFWRRKKDITPLAPSAQTITGNFTLQAQLAGSSGRSIAIAGYIYDGESKESLEQRLDLLQEVIERQRVRSEIPELEAKREQMIVGLQQAKEVLVEMEQKQREGKLSTTERQNVGNMRTNINRVSQEIEKGEKAIAEAKQKAGVR